ncbi:MAG TPA: DivIVA domain-containing protein, partial [Acidimicrobiia bacterium]|nr:DivIVA domain-containing protein [Acidimicrobiia bacterium]
MASEVTPDAIRGAEFRSVLRGLDRNEVEPFLDTVATRIERLQAKLEKLEAQLEESSGPNLESEFERVGAEVSSILQAAREAAESMRERASLDSARWRREAADEAETMAKEAAADAEALRRDAWVVGSELLEQAQVNAEAMRASAERDVLTVMGEAEREAHRLTSGARREAEDLVRNASMDAEKITAQATKRRDEIIDGANRQAAAAQERTRALENRRDELLEELENVRSTLTRLEGSLEERREALDLTTTAEPSSVRVVHPPAEGKEHWELGETVRVVHPDSPPQRADHSIADEMSEPVARIQDSEPPSEPEMRARPEPVAVVEPETVSPPIEPAGEEESEPASETTEAEEQGGSDEVEALFAALRGGGDTTPPAHFREGPAGLADGDEVSSNGGAGEEGTDWIAVRDSKLFPITNRALRGVKKAMTEIQNVVLDNLRTDGDWLPDEETIAESVHAELVAVWAESFAAGHAVA